MIGSGSNDQTHSVAELSSRSPAKLGFSNFSSERGVFMFMLTTLRLQT